MNIRLLICDVDGTLTDNKVTVDNKGNVSKNFSVIDGMGFGLCFQNNIKVAWITGSSDKCIEHRATQINRLSYFITGCKDKVKAVEEILEQSNLTWDNVAYIGDDINDAACIKKAAFSAVPADAIIKDLNLHNYTCQRKGGEGAVREFINKIIQNTLQVCW
jgi:3-deoxy-D-manno-octulosonate 8-phosphate phosphatase (KDO 8-P phosphatase)